MDHEADRDAIRGVESAYDAAWTAGDLDGLLDLFTEDAVIVNPRGEVASGIHEIRETLGAFLAGPAHNSRHTGAVRRIAFVSEDVAVVDGEARLDGLDTPDFPAGSLTHAFTDVLARRGDRWLIAHVRAYGLAESPQDEG